ncbi:TetR/AcrR family transcriptional regulator [Salipaludibacillus daqingensis]|uniref:TetR/AcrR family transcriptional regulator n=1 Tax=Salipaludibacillus daqingensis TaxID=3041001 RepID=UPI002476E5F2|nr:TetR/AcrR family transcriptional regulator [Salipaludibacillus daqingensis]
MPKDTFYNLPSEKRQFIIDVIIDEFYEYGFEKASISRIVQQAGIAKGSFYQYFINKNDLFSHVIEIITEKKFAYLKHIQEEIHELPFFDILTEMYMGALEFLKDNPKLATISDEFMKNSNEVRKKILGENVHKSNEFLAGLIQKGIDRNEINSNIDVLYHAHMLTSMSISIGDYYRNREKEKEDNEVDEDVYANLVHETVHLFKNGIGKG